MSNRYTAVFLSLILIAAFIMGLFIEPAESRANARGAWVGEYFPNATWEGDPAVVSADESIEMNWFDMAPYESLPSDGFSVRWTSQPFFQKGVYRLRVGADGNIKLLIDNIVVIEATETDGFATLTRDVRLPSGEHQLEVQYSEGQGMAGVLVDWSLAETSTEIFDLATQQTEVVAAPVSSPLVYVASTAIYTSPHLNAPQHAQGHFAQQYPLLSRSQDGAWIELQMPDGSSGWVLARYIYNRPPQVSQATPTR